MDGSARFYIVRDGILRQDLELYAVESPKITMESSAVIKTALSGSFRAMEGVDLAKDHIGVQLRQDGEFQNCGEFVVTTCREEWDSSKRHLWNIESYDLGYLVKRNRREERTSVEKGSSYMELIHNLLSQCGIIKIIADPCNDVLQTDRDWELGTGTLDIVNELLKEIAFDSLWFDADGNARIQRHRSILDARVDHVYQKGQGSIVHQECSSSWDIFSASNVFVAMVNSPDYEESLIAKAVNDERNSEVSTVNIGRIMAQPIRLDNIASERALQDYVDRVKEESMLSTETITFSTAKRIHGIGDIVALKLDGIDGIYQETGWTMELSYDGQMKHTAKRVMYV